jgi:sulfatase modifying factor 1
LGTGARIFAFAVALMATGGGIFAVIRVAAREHEDPARCGVGLVPVHARCCAPGQAVTSGHCVGDPSSCPVGMHVAEGRNGCVVDGRTVAFKGGRLSLGAEDWQADGVVQAHTALVGPFRMDTAEVTVERWTHCVRAGACRAVDDTEPGAPIAGVDPKEAERFCRFEEGRLPTGDEWLFAAMGPDARRFPWGPTGLVCRRAAFGLEDGPCTHGGGREIAGSRPDGATPDGLLDLAGNVAEWTTERDGSHVARGGSFASHAALELKSWAAETASPRARYVGFRCAYDKATAATLPH